MTAVPGDSASAARRGARLRRVHARRRRRRLRIRRRSRRRVRGRGGGGGVRVRGAATPVRRAAAGVSAGQVHHRFCSKSSFRSLFFLGSITLSIQRKCASNKLDLHSSLRGLAYHPLVAQILRGLRPHPLDLQPRLSLGRPGERGMQTDTKPLKKPLAYL